VGPPGPIASGPHTPASRLRAERPGVPPASRGERRGRSSAPLPAREGARGEGTAEEPSYLPLSHPAPLPAVPTEEEA